MTCSTLLQPYGNLKKPVSRAGLWNTLGWAQLWFLSSDLVSTCWYSVQTGVMQALALLLCMTYHLLPCAGQSVSAKPHIRLPGACSGSCSHSADNMQEETPAKPYESSIWLLPEQKWRGSAISLLRYDNYWATVQLYLPRILQLLFHFPPLVKSRVKKLQEHGLSPGMW